MSPKKTRTNPLDQLIADALASIGADRIPDAARRAIDADALAACEAMLHKRITGDYVGRMVALGLAARAEGGEGEPSPSQSKSPGTPQRGAQGDVDFRATKTLAAHDGAGEARRPNASTDPRTEGI